MKPTIRIDSKSGILRVGYSPTGASRWERRHRRRRICSMVAPTVLVGVAVCLVLPLVVWMDSTAEAARVCAGIGLALMCAGLAIRCK